MPADVLVARIIVLTASAMLMVAALFGMPAG